MGKHVIDMFTGIRLYMCYSTFTYDAHRTNNKVKENGETNMMEENYLSKSHFSNHILHYIH